jgi:hypothetical protein
MNGAPDIRTPHIDGIACAAVRVAQSYANGSGMLADTLRSPYGTLSTAGRRARVRDRDE